jgi:hypothetical protein
VKVVLRLVFFVALLISLACIVLLLNFTAPNPTGRRYSSAPVQTRGTAQAIGASGEQILSRDLHTPDNDDSDQLQCICNNPNTKPPASQCRVCLVSDPSIANYRRPDFISDKFIAESKNRQNLLYSYADQVDQITDYVTAAKLLKRPLWLYTRVDTLLSPQFDALVSSTGGGVIPYFTTPGYVDPVDQLARIGLIVALVVLAVTGLLELVQHALAVRLPPRPPRSHREPDPLTRSADKTDHAEDFVKKAREHHQRKIDSEESHRDDLD